MARPRTVRLLAAAVAVAVTIGTVTSAAGEAGRHSERADAGSVAAWVDVAVATVWIHRGSPREVDLPALQDPVQLHRWLGALDTATLRRALTSRVATQLLYGEPVVVRKTVDGLWSRVRIPDQTGSGFPTGIIGWVPRRQLSMTPLPSSAQVATITVPRSTITLRNASGWRAGPRLSYATTLPYLRTSAGGHWAVVATPGGGRGRLASGDVVVHEPDTPAVAPSRHVAVTQAKQFLGLPYLWAGMSAYGFDCSGFTTTIYRQLGITLMRDAADQARQGTAVGRHHLRPGDLVFFSTGPTWSSVFHVGMYVGHGTMLAAPRSGAAVSTEPLWHFGLTSDYWGARRYL